MIEIKANLAETFQQSQGKNGEYEKTSSKHGIPLFYIIPRNYYKKNKIPDIGIIIEWEEIIKIAKECEEKSSIAEQIRYFVELKEDETLFTKEEKELLNSGSELHQIYENKNKIKKLITDISSTKKVKEDDFYSFGAYWDNFFLGYTFIYNNFDDYDGKYEFILNIQETSNNTILGKKGVYYFEGWYYIPLKKLDGIKALTLSDLRKDKEIHQRLYGNLKFEKITKENIVELDENKEKIQLIRNFICKLQSLCYESDIRKRFKVGSEKFEIKDKWFGCLYTKKSSRKEKNIFIGFDFEKETENPEFIFEFNARNNWNSKTFKEIDSSLYREFLESKTSAELINKFGCLIDKALETIK